MKAYPKIPGSKNCPSDHCIAFEKYDGSNLRWEWSKKRGFYKFGTRRRLFDHTDTVFSEAIPIFMNKYSKDLDVLFKKHKELRGGLKT